MISRKLIQEMILKASVAPVLLLLALYPSISFAQKQRAIPICKQATFAALKPLPKLDYDCPAGLGESDDKILKLAARRAELKRAAAELEALTDAAWWQADVEALSACDLHGKPGALSADEKQQFRNGEFSLQGNHQIRLVLLADPCYQTGYNGANTFLLYRKAGKVFVTQVLDGYYPTRKHMLKDPVRELGCAEPAIAGMDDSIRRNEAAITLIKRFPAVPPTVPYRIKQPHFAFWTGPATSDWRRPGPFSRAC